MSQSDKAHHEGIAARIDALKSARRMLKQLGPAARGSVRRLAKSLISDFEGNPDMQALARMVSVAPDDGLAEMADALIDAVIEPDDEATEIPEAEIFVVTPDDALYIHLARSLDQPGRTLHRIRNGVELDTGLRVVTPDLIVLQLELEDDDGRNCLIRLRRRSGTATTPVVIIAQESPPQTKAECFALGANDFLEIPLEAEVISASVASRLGRISVHASQSTRDLLTGLSNRFALEEAFGRAGAMAARGMMVALGILDIDDFATLTEKYGDEGVEAVLRSAASGLSKSLRRTDLLSHWEGAEFVALFWNTSHGQAVRCMERCLASARDECFDADGENFTITLSAGVVEVTGQETLEECLSSANRLLLVAREQGKDRVVSNESGERPATRKVLLAESDHLTATVVKQRLGKQGFDITHFVTAEAALTAAMSGRFALVITNVADPDMGGLNLIEQLRQIPEYKEIPIMMVTTMGPGNEIVDGFERGANDYVVRPFSPAELSARVHRMLRKGMV